MRKVVKEDTCYGKMAKREGDNERGTDSWERNSVNGTE